jgi:hypothetical protein
MLGQTHKFPPMPQIGQPESYYAKLVKMADKAGNHYAHEAAKVGQYVTLALSPHLEWPEKLRFFQHALNRHCNPPPIPDEPVWVFYRNLTDLVRQYAGHEALRAASAEDDHYARRLALGSDRERIAAEAEIFFRKLLGDCAHRPEWFSDGDWEQLMLIRNQWI